MKELIARLSAARRRLNVRRSLIGAAWSGLAAALFVAVLKVAPLAIDMSAPTPGSEWRWAGLVLSIGLLLTVTWVWRSQPDLVEMGRRADGCFHLDERMSTSVELNSRTDGADRPSPVVAALFRDAATHAARVDPRRLVPIGIPGPAVALAVVLTGVLALELISATDRAGPPPGAALLAAAADPDAESAAEVILGVAELLRQEAERESSDYLRVVATSLEQLAGEVVEQGSGGQAVADEMTRLLEQAEAGSNVLESDADADGVSLTLASIEEWLQAEGQRELVPRADASTRESTGPEAEPATRRSVASELVARARRALESVRVELADEPADAESQAEERVAAESADEVAPEEMMEGESSGALPTETSIVGSRPLANEEIGGGAMAIDDAPGSDTPAQGSGGGMADVTADRVEVPDVASSRDFELPTEGGSRRRLPEEIVPQTRFTEVTESVLPRGDWQQTAQEQVTSGYLGISYRDVVSRYFLARIHQAEAEAESPEP